MNINSLLALLAVPFALGGDQPKWVSKSRSIQIKHPYLLVPISNGTRSCRLNISVEGKKIHSADVNLADGKPDWWAWLSVAELQGKSVLPTISGNCSLHPFLYAAVAWVSWDC